jgi:hypothetical protein
MCHSWHMPELSTSPDEQPIGLTVGRRKSYSGGLAGMRGFFELIIKLRGDRPFLPRGVYKFKTHKELDRWTLEMLTRATPDRRT